MHDYFYHGFLRMDWRLGNPNKTAALIAMLMVVIWSLSCIPRFGFWIALSLFTVFGVCEVDTYSRGGFVAATIGLALMALKAPRPWKSIRVGAVVVAFWTIIATSVLLQASDRYKQGLVGEDGSITHRVAIWKDAPRMMVDAPGGWGLGNSGNAYVQWYQPLDRSEKYRTLVSSHLTWLVELSWPLRFLYLLGWILVLLFCDPFEKGLRAIPFCTLLTFFIANLFSSVGESLFLWIPPVTALAFVLANRFKYAEWPSLQHLLISIPCALSIVTLIFILGSFPASLSIHNSDGKITIGNLKPDTWIVVDTNVIGENFGRRLRSSLPQGSSVGFVQAIGQLPKLKGETLVICGGVKQDEFPALQNSSQACGRLVFLNPTFNPQELSINPSKTQVLAGDLFTVPNARLWSQVMTHPIILLGGVGHYIDQWPEILSKR